MDLFQSIPIADLPGTPLPEKLRPQAITAFVGQSQVLQQVQKYIASGFLPSLIFWGPPGTGKTSLARVLAQSFQCHFESINAVESGAKQLKEIGEVATQRRRESQRQTILFVDEIHRFNKSQQDILLPFVEKGDLVLIGATTENPSYELNRALLSRCRLVVFEKLDRDSLLSLMQLASRQSQKQLCELLTSEALQWLVSWSDGDGRRILTSFEEVLADYSIRAQEVYPLNVIELQALLGKSVLGYDKASDQHYDCASALIKSIRGSDPQAGLYYLARMIKGGEDPVFIARRLVILASEDVGNADPRALSLAIAGLQAVELVGLPECAINLAQVVCYLASAPKSNRSYLGWKRAGECVDRTGSLSIPPMLRSTQTPTIQSEGDARYKYPHDYPKAWVSQAYLPTSVSKEVFYEPSEVGFEKQIIEFQKWLRASAK